MLTQANKLQRQFFWWVVGGSAVFVAVLVLLVVRPSFCPPQNDEWTAKSYQYSAPADYGTEEYGNIIAERKKRSQAHSANPYDKYKDYALEVLCSEIKVTDLALVFFTYVLALVGLYQMRSTDAAMKAAERAYVYGGGPYGIPTDDFDPKKNFPEARFAREPKRLTIQNYGKTAALITKVEWGFCPEKEFKELRKHMSVSQIIDNKRLSTRLKVEKVKYPHDVYPPTGDKFHFYRHVEFDRSKHVGEVFFGRLCYDDVFGDHHHSAFALLLTEKFSDSYGDSYTHDQS